MKSILSLSVVAMMFVMIACSSGDKPQAQANVQPAEIKTTIQLPTLKCNNCARHIKSALANIEGIKDVNINVDDKKAEIVFATDKIDLPKIEKAIANSGYDANNTKRDAVAYDGLAECCK